MFSSEKAVQWVRENQQVGTPVSIIGLAGRAGVGKTTLASQVTELGDYVRHVSFADEVRMAALRELVHSPRFAPFREHDPQLLNTARRILGAGDRESARVWFNTVKPMVINAAGDPITFRDLLIEIGVGEREHDPDVWVRRLNDRLVSTLPSADDDMSPETTLIIVDDVRFHNEVQWVQRAGGVVVWLSRDGVSDAPAGVSESLTVADCDTKVHLGDDPDRTMFHLLVAATRARGGMLYS